MDSGEFTRERKLSAAVLTAGDVGIVHALVARVHRETAVRVRIILVERPPRPFGIRSHVYTDERGGTWMVPKKWRTVLTKWRGFSHLLWMDGIPHREQQSARSRLETFCGQNSIEIHWVDDLHAEATIRKLQDPLPDVGITLDTGTIDPKVTDLPRLGSISLRSGGGGERNDGRLGFSEVLRGEKKVRLSVDQVVRATGIRWVWAAMTLPIDDFDTPESVAVKAQFMGRDLLVEALRKISESEAPAREEMPEQRDKRSVIDPRALRAFRRNFAERYGRARGRRALVFVKSALAAAYLYCGFVQIRNILRRRAGRVPGVIVNFHRVADSRPEHWMTIGTANFDRYLRFIESRYRVVSIAELRSRLAHGTNREPLVAITFDDGYEECATCAVAALANRGLPASFYVCTGYLDGTDDLTHDANRRNAGLPKMRAEHLRELASRGFELGSHTVTHLDFRDAPAERIEMELVSSKRTIEAIVRLPVEGLAVPFGSVAHCRAEVFVAARRTGYQYVMSHFDGVNFPGSGTFHLRRVRPPLEGTLLLHACIEGWRGVRGLFDASPQSAHPDR